MKRMVWVFWGFLAALSGLWLLADTLWPAQAGYFAFRTVWVQYSGVLVMGMMSLAMVLAVRPVWLEPHLRGLDKMYRLHKWLGVGALVAGTVHWLWAQGTKWAVGWGWLTRPARRGQPPESSGIEAVLRGWRHTAEDLGEWAFYAAVVLIALALIKRFPYRLFVKTHHLLAVAYLVLVFHTVVLLQFDYWSQPIGWVMALLTAVGTVSALLVLLGRVGAGRTAGGAIEALQHYPALGDHTAQLPQTLSVGQRVTVEGPYGCFTFGGPQARQIWIGAGIGITPFIARMKQLAREGGGPHEIDLIHSTVVEDPVALGKMRADAQAAGIRLHVLVDARDGLLSGERLRRMVAGWRDASVWFCGPAGFGQALRADLLAQGLPARAFHQELFEMR